MIEYILEIICLFFLFRGALGYNYRQERRMTICGMGMIFVSLVIILMFPNHYELLLFLKYVIPIVVISMLFNGKFTILTTIAICLIEILRMLDNFYEGIWILLAQGDILAVDLEATYLLSELSCLLILILLTRKLKRQDESFYRRVEKLNPILFTLFIVCSVLINYSPWYVGDTSTMLPQIIYGRNLVKNGILAITIIGIFCLVCVTVIQKKELKRMNILNERCIQEQTEQYRRTAQEEKTLRKFRHDYNAHIEALQAIVTSGDVDRISQYVNTLFEIRSTQRVVCTNNLVCDAILSNYMESCQEKNIDFKVRGIFPESISISDTDLCVLISNGISNAFEAAQKCKSERSIRVNIGNSGNFIVISITNTADEVPTIKGGALITTKKEQRRHGFGTQNMQETAKKNNGRVTWRIENHGVVVTEIILMGTKRSE